ncbi:MAG: hypothetical protein K6A38_10650 [Lachnospiraceae bacterium]|nr:hypothetical protein [Lachnospiraceae bacterium]
MKKRVTILLLALITLTLFVGCADSGKSVSSKETRTEEESDKEDDKENGKKEKSSKKEKNGKKKKKNKTSENDEKKKESHEDQDIPLYQKICGTYCYEYGENEEGTVTYPLDIVNFGGNLYAFGGASMDSFDSDHIGSYSFWAMELIPEEADDLFATDSDECRFGVLTFSIMSNLGKYWNEPEMITVRVIDEGLEMEDLPFIEESPALFMKNDRVERAFCYMNEGSADEKTDKDLKGIWQQADSQYPVFVEFMEDNNIKIYRKQPLSEVYLYGGSYTESSPGILECSLSTLGSGGMPTDFSMEYSIENGSMDIRFNDFYDTLADSINADDELTFKKIGAEDIPIITMEDIKDIEITNIYEDMDE